MQQKVIANIERITKNWTFKHYGVTLPLEILAGWSILKAAGTRLNKAEENTAALSAARNSLFQKTRTGKEYHFGRDG